MQDQHSLSLCRICILTTFVVALIGFLNFWAISKESRTSELGVGVRSSRSLQARTKRTVNQQDFQDLRHLQHLEESDTTSSGKQPNWEDSQRSGFGRPNYTSKNVFNLCRNNMKCLRITSMQYLKNISSKCHKGRFKVPNIVHYIWFGCDRDFDFYHYISMVTTLKNIIPCALIIHADCQPGGQWWEQISQQNGVAVVFQEPPQKVYNFTLSRVHHQADVARIDILLKWGGIYLDDTVLVIKSFDSLRNYSAVLPFQEQGILNNGVIVSEKGSKFLKVWREESYGDYRGYAWAYNSCRYPWRLWKMRDDLDLHVEMTSFLPKWDGWKSVFFGNYPWRDNYAIHLWTHAIKRLRVRFKYPEAVKSMDTAFGEIARKTLYGTARLPTSPAI